MTARWSISASKFRLLGGRGGRLPHGSSSGNLIDGT